MSGFEAIGHYAPALVLLAGLLGFAGFAGLGAGLLRFLRLGLPEPWRLVAAVLLGVQAMSLTVQCLAMAGLATPLVLQLLAAGLFSFGIAPALHCIRRAVAWRLRTIGRSAALPFGIACTAMLACMLVAIAPSTRIDELYYHMLLPSRIVADGGLHFYREPWEAAILPHMAFQFAATPLHAIGLPDAGNLVSWALAGTMLWFTRSLVLQRGGSTAWAWFWAAALGVGIYPVVCHVTSGGHAMGALALAAAAAALGMRGVLLAATGPARYAALISFLALCGGMTKVTLLPLAVGMVLIEAWNQLAQAPRRTGIRPVVALAAPWLAFFAPITLWTWAHAGAPFGPMLGGFFPGSIYAAGWTAAQFLDIRATNAVTYPDALLLACIQYSPLLAVGMLGALAATDLPKAARAALAGLLLFQAVLILALLLPDVRYFGGFHYGLLALFAAHAARPGLDYFRTPRAIAFASAVFLLPWLGSQLYYASQFFPVALGLQAKEDFYRRYVAFYDDYLALDRILPGDAVLYAHFRTSNVYAPRPVFIDAADLPAGKPAFALFSELDAREAFRELPGYRAGKVVHANARAVTETYRTPGKPPWVQPIRVVELVRQ